MTIPVGGWGVDQMVPGAVLDSMGTAEVVVAQSPLAPSVRTQARRHRARIRSTGTTVAAGGRTRAQRGLGGTGSRGRALDPSAARRHGAPRAGARGRLLPARSSRRQTAVLRARCPARPARPASAVLGALACAGRESVDAVCGDTVDRTPCDSRGAGRARPVGSRSRRRERLPRRARRRAGGHRRRRSPPGRDGPRMGTRPGHGAGRGFRGRASVIPLSSRRCSPRAAPCR